AYRINLLSTLTLEAASLKHCRQDLQGKKHLLFCTVKPGSILPDEFFGRVTIQTYSLVTASNVSMEISRKDGVLQLIEQVRLRQRPPRPTGAATIEYWRFAGFLHSWVDGADQITPVANARCHFTPDRANSGGSRIAPEFRVSTYDAATLAHGRSGRFGPVRKPK